MATVKGWKLCSIPAQTQILQPEEGLMVLSSYPWKAQEPGGQDSPGARSHVASVLSCFHLCLVKPKQSADCYWPGKILPIRGVPPHEFVPAHDMLRS